MPDQNLHGRRVTDQEQDAQILLILEKLGNIERTLGPISTTYNTVTKLGKWTMATLVFISVLIGIALGAKNLLVNKS